MDPETFHVIFDKIFKLKEDMDNPKTDWTLKEKSKRIMEIQSLFESEVRGALNDQVDAALLVVNRYKRKYLSVQEENHSVAMTGTNPLFYGGEHKKNLDTDDKMVMLLLKLITDDLEDLKDRG